MPSSPLVPLHVITFKSLLLSPQDLLLSFHKLPNPQICASLDFYRPTPACWAWPCMSWTPRSGPHPGRTCLLLFIGVFGPSSYAFPYSFGLRSTAWFTALPHLLYPSDSKPCRPLQLHAHCCALEKLYIPCFQYDHWTFCIQGWVVLLLAGLWLHSFLSLFSLLLTTAYSLHCFYRPRPST